MINPKAIREGNLLESTLSPKRNVGVVTAEIRQWIIDNPNQTTWIRIPLSDEWMGRLGLEREGKDWTDKESYRFKFSNGICKVSEIKSDAPGIPPLDLVGAVRYVHELQNLYFDLTGKHLNWNLLAK
jgi:hypothetical protein